MKPRTPTALQAELTAHYLDAPGAAAHLGIDKSHLCAQLRAGKLPGSFQFGNHRRAPWIIPRAAVEAYSATHVDADRHRRPSARKGEPVEYARPGRWARRRQGPEGGG